MNQKISLSLNLPKRLTKKQRKSCVDKTRGAMLRNDFHSLLSYVFLTTTLPSYTSYYIPPTIILLIGMCTNLTKNPTKPMIKNPTPVARAILANSVNCVLSNKQQQNRQLKIINQKNKITSPEVEK